MLLGFAQALHYEIAGNADMVVNGFSTSRGAAAIQRVEQLKVAGCDSVGGFMGFGD
jgi:hypothetical protein